MNRRDFLKSLGVIVAAPVALQASGIILKERSPGLSTSAIDDPIGKFCNTLKWEVVEKNFGSSGTIDPFDMLASVGVKTTYKGNEWGNHIEYTNGLFTKYQKEYMERHVERIKRSVTMGIMKHHNLET